MMAPNAAQRYAIKRLGVFSVRPTSGMLSNDSNYRGYQ